MTASRSIAAASLRCAEAVPQAEHPVVRTHPVTARRRSRQPQLHDRAERAYRLESERSSSCSIATPKPRNSSAVSAGGPIPWRSGTIAAPAPAMWDTSRNAATATGHIKGDRPFYRA